MGQISILSYIYPSFWKRWGSTIALPSQTWKPRSAQGITEHFVGVTRKLQSATLDSWVDFVCSDWKHKGWRRKEQREIC